METSHERKSPLHTAVLAALVLVLCYLAAKLGGTLIITVPQILWPLWPGCAILVAILLGSPQRIWPILIPAGLAGFVLYDLPAGVSINSMAVLLLADIAEVLVAAWGVQYFLQGVAPLDSLKAFGKYVLVTVVLGPLVTSSIGIAAMTGDRWISWRNAFLSDGLAFLTLAPAILSWIEHFRGRSRRSRGFYLEAAALAIALLSLSFVVFVRGAAHASPALLYSLVPILLWSALRFGSAGAGTSASIVALISIWCAVRGRGPFAEADPINRVLELQIFLVFTAVPFMILAVLVEERKRQEAILRESEGRFRLMADTSPILMWMSGTDKLCTFFNRGWLNFTGQSMDDELGNGWTSGIHPDDLERCLGVYSAAFDSRNDFEMEYRLRRHTGDYRWIVHYGVPRFSSSGTFCGFIGSCIDITERKQSEMSSRELSGHLLRAQEEERARIARELHDDISQRMAFLQIGLEQFQNIPKLSANNRKELHDLARVASVLSSDLHSLSHQLHPTRLELQGLVAAMGSLCRELSDQHQLRVKFVSHPVPGEIPMAVGLCLYRIAQEALRNVAKHGDTLDAKVELSVSDQGIDFCISDSGTGFNPQAVHLKGGLGLLSMRERVRLIEGQLSIESKPLRGTQVRVHVPLSVNHNTRRRSTEAS